MSKELSRALMCIKTKSGILIWVEKDRVKKFQEDLTKITAHFFAEFDGQTINTAEIEGIFSAKTLEDYRRIKNGEWQCSCGKWNKRNESCVCNERIPKDLKGFPPEWQEFKGKKFSSD
jgi:hypothetical protein